MAGKQVPMSVVAAVIAHAEGQKMNVSEVCRKAGIAPKTFYKYRARYGVEGLAGFEPRSRRPHTSPNQTPVEVEDVIVELRKQLDDDGLDHGALTIQWHLEHDPRLEMVPSVQTVHRVLTRRGFITPQPQKRPKSSWCRFEAAAPNEMWQIDATEYSIITGPVNIFNIIDDHSRLACRSRAAETATGVEAWATFCEAAERWGLPAAALSDNGLCFSGRLRGFEVMFEAHLRDAGIRPITGRGHHPQTTGKVERFQQTLKQWLRRYDDRDGPATDLSELQQRLDEFCAHYNHHRPHQGIGRTTPHSRWNATSRSTPGEPIDHPTPRPETHHITTDSRGTACLHRYHIALGITWAHHPVTVIIDEHHATVIAEHHLIRHLTLDHTRRYQPTGKPRGGPHQPRQLPS